MGTSGSYSGSGGKLGDDLRDTISDWLNTPPPTPPVQPVREPVTPDQPEPRGPDAGRPPLDPHSLLPVIGMLRPRSRGGGGADGPGGGSGGRGGGGPQRTAAQAANIAGRAGAAAYAYRAADAATLERLGLDYAALAALQDPFEIVKRIVEAVCGPRATSTIEDHEQRLVAAEVAEWVLIERADGAAPAPEEIVRHAIALVIADTALSETGQLVNESEHAEVAESDIRDAAEALAARAQLSSAGVTEDEFTRAIEDGIEALREILEGGG
jgi:hypothetical protein